MKQRLALLCFFVFQVYFGLGYCQVQRRGAPVEIEKGTDFSQELVERAQQLVRGSVVDEDSMVFGSISAPKVLMTVQAEDWHTIGEYHVYPVPMKLNTRWRVPFKGGVTIQCALDSGFLGCIAVSRDAEVERSCNYCVKGESTFVLSVILSSNSDGQFTCWLVSEVAEQLKFSISTRPYPIVRRVLALCDSLFYGESLKGRQLRAAVSKDANYRHVLSEFDSVVVGDKHFSVAKIVVPEESQGDLVGWYFSDNETPDFKNFVVLDGGFVELDKSRSSVLMDTSKRSLWRETFPDNRDTHSYLFQVRRDQFGDANEIYLLQRSDPGTNLFFYHAFTDGFDNEFSTNLPLQLRSGLLD